MKWWAMFDGVTRFTTEATEITERSSWFLVPRRHDDTRKNPCFRTEVEVGRDLQSALPSALPSF